MAQMVKYTYTLKRVSGTASAYDGSRFRLVVRLARAVRDIASEPWFSSNNNYKSLDETPRLDREGRSDDAEAVAM
jgi:hypothetical protein